MSAKRYMEISLTISQWKRILDGLKADVEAALYQGSNDEDLKKIINIIELRLARESVDSK